MFSDDQLLPLSALQHLLFCERQAALIHVEQLWLENGLTAEGRLMHRRVDAGKRQRRPAKATDRSARLVSYTLGLFGHADVVERRPSEPLLPVEYKRGRPKPHDADRVQLCAQAICIEEMEGVAVPRGAIFYGETKRRLDVPFDTALRETTVRAAERLHAIIAGRLTPRAAYEPRKCDRCSLRPLCMPEVLDGSESASRYVSRSVAMVLSGDGPRDLLGAEDE
jgi:CRISPR-associated exonuclease Cas4